MFKGWAPCKALIDEEKGLDKILSAMMSDTDLVKIAKVVPPLHMRSAHSITSLPMFINIFSSI